MVGQLIFIERPGSGVDYANLFNQLICLINNNKNTQKHKMLLTCYEFHLKAQLNTQNMSCFKYSPYIYITTAPNKLIKDSTAKRLKSRASRLDDIHSLCRTEHTHELIINYPSLFLSHTNTKDIKVSVVLLCYSY